MSIYADLILDHYQNPRNNKKLENPTSQVDVSNPLCGDKLHFEITEREGLVHEIGFTGEGCAISIASASMVSEYAKGKTILQLKTLSKEDVLALLGIELSPNRMKCGLLSWEGLLKMATH
ncbi:iron-sulfur cluster assembly scaffold protein [Candidatus Woesebacteria bacterium]|nr:iron-sulfur cluster assembly scaffold protein [Candidatus Woesebacteria bacterium]